MTRWSKFRWWMARKLCPRITIIVCCGKTRRGVFYTTKQFVFKKKPRPKIALACEFKFNKDYEVQFGDKTLSKAEILAAIDSVTSAETIEETTERLQGDIQGVKPYIDSEKPE